MTRLGDPIVLVLASANPDKAAEITAILSAHGAFAVQPRPEGISDVEETGETLLENARLKGRALAEATGLPAVADDTGLFVDTLGGAPGVYSARYAGEDATYADNVQKLLAELSLRERGAVDRRARFTTVALVAYPDGTEVFAEGSVEGRIAEVACGDGGFGYDPIFIPDEGNGSTFAEMTAAAKHAVSHRGRAFRALGDALTSKILRPSAPA